MEINNTISKKQFAISVNKSVVIATIFCLPIYISIELILGAQFNIGNLVLVFLLVLIISSAICDMKRRGIRLSNTFAVCFFGVLLLNCLNISRLQEPKTIRDMYYYLFGPSLFYFMLALYEKTSNNNNHLVKIFGINPDIIGIIMLVLCVVLKSRIFILTGIRLFSNSWKTAERELFVVPVESGLSDLFMWLSLMLVPMMKKKYLKFFGILIPILFTVLSATREYFIFICIFVSFLWMLHYGKKLFMKTNICKILIIFIGMLVIFSVWGNYRQIKRGWADPQNAVKELLESNTDNMVINWVYGYTGINFDVLKQNYIEKDVSGDYRALLVPMIRILEGSNGVKIYKDTLKIDGINGFNASTFLSLFIKELGVFYFVDVFLLGIIVIVLDKLCCLSEFQGGKIFLLVMTSLTFYGNYYLIYANLFYSLVAGIILSLFIDTSGKKGAISIYYKKII